LNSNLEGFTQPAKINILNHINEIPVALAIFMYALFDLEHI